MDGNEMKAPRPLWECTTYEQNRWNNSVDSRKLLLTSIAFLSVNLTRPSFSQNVPACCVHWAEIGKRMRQLISFTIGRFRKSTTSNRRAACPSRHVLAE